MSYAYFHVPEEVSGSATVHQYTVSVRAIAAQTTTIKKQTAATRRATPTAVTSIRRFLSRSTKTTGTAAAVVYVRQSLSRTYQAVAAQVAGLSKVIAPTGNGATSAQLPVLSRTIVHMTSVAGSPVSALVILRSLSSSLLATATQLSSLSRAVARAVPATGLSAVSLSIQQALVRTISATGTLASTLMVRQALFRAVSATTFGTSAVRHSLLRTASATAPGAPFLAFRQSLLRTIAASTNGASTFSLRQSLFRTIGVSTTGTSTLSMRQSLVRAMTASAGAVAALSIHQSLFRTVSAIAVQAATAFRRTLATRPVMAAQLTTIARQNRTSRLVIATQITTTRHAIARQIAAPIAAGASFAAQAAHAILTLATTLPAAALGRFTAKPIPIVAAVAATLLHPIAATRTASSAAQAIIVRSAGIRRIASSAPTAALGSIVTRFVTGNFQAVATQVASLNRGIARSITATSGTFSLLIRSTFHQLVTSAPSAAMLLAVKARVQIGQATASTAATAARKAGKVIAATGAAVPALSRAGALGRSVAAPAISGIIRAAKLSRQAFASILATGAPTGGHTITASATAATLSRLTRGTFKPVTGLVSPISRITKATTRLVNTPGGGVIATLTHLPGRTLRTAVNTVSAISRASFHQTEASAGIIPQLQRSLSKAFRSISTVPSAAATLMSSVTTLASSITQTTLANLTTKPLTAFVEVMATAKANLTGLHALILLAQTAPAATITRVAGRLVDATAAVIASFARGRPVFISLAASPVAWSFARGIIPRLLRQVVLLPFAVRNAALPKGVRIAQLPKTTRTVVLPPDEDEIMSDNVADPPSFSPMDPTDGDILSFDYSRRATAGDTIISATVTSNPTGLNIIGAPVIAGLIVQVTVSGVTTPPPAPPSYGVRCTVSFASGRRSSWTIPLPIQSL